MHGITNYLKRSDIRVFTLFNQKLHCTFLNWLMVTITQLGSLVFIIGLSVILLIIGRQTSNQIGLEMAAALAVCQGVTHLIKRLVNRPRPYRTLENAIAINPPNCQYSFPSGHTSAAFTLALVLASSLPGLRMIFYGLASLVGISRIYLGVHYPTDVLAGIMTAYATFVLSGALLAHLLLL